MACSYPFSLNLLFYRVFVAKRADSAVETPFIPVGIRIVGVL